VEILCEVEPPRTPDLTRLREQIAVLAPVVDSFLVPDNHLGAATVSSIATAREVLDQGGKPVAVLNARDRNVLGFRRDLLTAAAWGVDHFLFVYGDRPKEGRSVGDLTVRGMINEVSGTVDSLLFRGYPSFKCGATIRLGQELQWRKAADWLCVQVTFQTKRLFEWRAQLDYSGRMYAGVLVLASRRMAESVNASIPGIRVPQAIVDKLDDPHVGLDLACEQIEAVRSSGLFTGVHLIPVNRYREMAARLAV
jgi:5,10-methylenetetrahydrofolate reductase